MTILTDELIDKAARALYTSMNCVNWEEQYDSIQKPYLDRARAALEAVLPDVIEACARALEMAVIKAKSGDSAYDLAEAIRNLSPKQKD